MHALAPLIAAGLLAASGACRAQTHLVQLACAPDVQSGAGPTYVLDQRSRTIDITSGAERGKRMPYTETESAYVGGLISNGLFFVSLTIEKATLKYAFYSALWPSPLRETGTCKLVGSPR